MEFKFEGAGVEQSEALHTQQKKMLLAAAPISQPKVVSISESYARRIQFYEHQISLLRSKMQFSEIQEYERQAAVFCKSLIGSLSSAKELTDGPYEVTWGTVLAPKRQRSDAHAYVCASRTENMEVEEDDKGALEEEEARRKSIRDLVKSSIPSVDKWFESDTKAKLPSAGPRSEAPSGGEAPSGAGGPPCGGAGGEAPPCRGAGRPLGPLERAGKARGNNPGKHFTRSQYTEEFMTFIRGVAAHLATKNSRAYTARISPDGEEFIKTPTSEEFRLNAGTIRLPKDRRCVGCRRYYKTKDPETCKNLAFQMCNCNQTRASYCVECRIIRWVLEMRGTSPEPQVPLGAKLPMGPQVPPEGTSGPEGSFASGGTRGQQPQREVSIVDEYGSLRTVECSGPGCTIHCSPEELYILAIAMTEEDVAIETKRTREARSRKRRKKERKVVNKPI